MTCQYLVLGKQCRIAAVIISIDACDVGKEGDFIGDFLGRVIFGSTASFSTTEEWTLYMYQSGPHTCLEWEYERCRDSIESQIS